MKRPVGRSPVDMGPSLARRGWAFGWLCLGAVFGGMALGQSDVIQLGILGFLILVGADLMARLNVRGLSVERTVPRHVFAGEDLHLRLTLKNEKRWLDSFALEVEDSLLPYAVKGMNASWLRAGDARQLQLETRLVKRGAIRKAGIVCRSTFPFGFFRTTRVYHPPIDITVFPKTFVPKELEQREFVSLLDGSNELVFARSESGDLRGLREFVPGDPVKRIHWPSSARHQGLMVRELDEPVPERINFLFHSYTPDGFLPWPDAFETSVSLMAGLLRFCRRRGIPLSLAAGFNRWMAIPADDPAGLVKPLALLGRAEPDYEKSLLPMIRALHGLTGEGPVFILSDTPLEHWISEIPPVSRPVVCLDNEQFRVKRPVFRFA